MLYIVCVLYNALPSSGSAVCSESLEQLQSELSLWPSGLTLELSQPLRNVAVPSEILSSLFEGQLTSQVRGGGGLRAN